MTAVSYESELERTGSITITIKGVSMRPLFHADSDAILVKKCGAEALNKLDIVLFKRPGSDGWQYVLHRIVGRRQDGSFILANKDFEYGAEVAVGTEAGLARFDGKEFVPCGKTVSLKAGGGAYLKTV